MCIVASIRRSLSARKSLDLEPRARLVLIISAILAGKEIVGLLTGSFGLASISERLGSKSAGLTFGGRKIPIFKSLTPADWLCNWGSSARLRLIKWQVW